MKKFLFNPLLFSVALENNPPKFPASRKTNTGGQATRGQAMREHAGDFKDIF